MRLLYHTVATTRNVLYAGPMPRTKKPTTGEFTIYIGVGDSSCCVYILDSNGDAYSRQFVGGFRRAKRLGKKLKKLAEQGIQVWC